MSKESINFLELIKEKKYSKILSIIENEIDKDKLTSGLMNLSGVCRMMTNNSNESIKLAINDFRNSYLKEKDKNKSIEPFKNLVNASVIYFDNEFTKNENALGENFFEEIISLYNQNKDIFESNFGLMKAILKVFKRTSNVKNVIECLKKIIELKPDSDAIASYIYFNNFIYDWSQLDFLENSKILNDKLPTYPSKDLVKLKSSKNEKINIGFISSDLKSKHSVTYFFKSIILNYDNEKFNIYIYHNHNVEDDTTKEYKRYVSNISHISHLNDVEVINKIRNDGIDIIIDINGFSSNHRLALFKNRLAPIQILWCGYTNTTGIDEVDYLIVDKNLIDPKEENLYSEKIIYLPNIWNCHSGYDFKRLENKMPFQDNKFITFGSFNNFLKINDEVVEVWASILNKVKNSKLILKTSISVSQELYIKKFEKYGVLGSIIFSKYSKNFNDHLDRYKQIDIALDTFPYNGVTTSFEAIWMNVPVLVMDGHNFNSRCGASINKNLDLTNLIAHNKKDYIDKAINLAQNHQMLFEIRKNLYENVLKTPLFDKKKFSKEFFSALEKIYN